MAASRPWSCNKFTEGRRFRENEVLSSDRKVLDGNLESDIFRLSGLDLQQRSCVSMNVMG